MGREERDIRLQIMLQPAELKAIEEWRFNRRMPSRAAAVRELLRRGLAPRASSWRPTACNRAISASRKNRKDPRSIAEGRTVTYRLAGVEPAIDLTTPHGLVIASRHS
jgi:hypothetical protein